MQINVDYMLSNNLPTKAEVNILDSVFLWIGTYVMYEYKMDEAKAFLNTNLKNAKDQLKRNNTDLEFLKDLLTIEVNHSRIYNEDARRNQIAKGKAASDKTNIGGSTKDKIYKIIKEIPY